MIYVVGYNNPMQDGMAMDFIQSWLQKSMKPCYTTWGLRLEANQYEDFDMMTKPERGDVMDAIKPGVKLVVALHLYGMGQMSPRIIDETIDGLPPPYFYTRENGYMLKRCMENGTVLIAVGDQPWAYIQKMIHMRKNIFLYEKE